MVLLVTLFLMQDVQSQADRIRAAMAPALAQQRASVAAQMQAAGPLAVSRPMRSMPQAPCEPIPEMELAPMIDAAATKQNVSPALVREVMREESGFRPCAVSPAGAAGLMQLMPATQAQFQVRNPFSPVENLDAGTKLLRQLMDRYNGDIPLALGAYNAGIERVEQNGKIAVPEIPETRNYVFDILNRFLKRAPGVPEPRPAPLP
jgi:soluble lytic murein transglycosylase-like protein